MLFVKDTPQGVQIVNAKSVVQCTFIPGLLGIGFVRKLIALHNKRESFNSFLSQLEYWMEMFGNAQDKNSVYFEQTSPVLQAKAKEVKDLLAD